MLLSIWALSPLLLLLDPTLFGLLDAHTGLGRRSSTTSRSLWLALGVAARSLFRTVQLFFIRDVQTGLVWCTKILTDPFHDVKLYHKSPLHLLRGELIDPIVAARDTAQSVEPCRPARGRGGAASRRMHLTFDGGCSSARRPSTTSRRLASPRRRRRSARRPREVGVRVVVAEDQPAAADPAEREPFGAQVVLEHPVVAATAACSTMVQTETRFATRTGRPLAGEPLVQLARRARSSARRAAS